MKYLRYLLRIVFRILSGSYSYPKIPLLVCYIRLVSKSIIRHKLTSGNNSGIEVMTENILGFSIQFYSYPELIYLFEEIFIDQVYKFSCDTSKPYIVDCGSNIGMSLFYFKKIFPKATILAFEPEAKTFKLLKENVERNNLKNISLLNYALSDFEGSASLFVRTQPNASLNASLIAGEIDSYSEMIQTKRLSNYLHEIVNLLKIDVEGAESQILNDVIGSEKTNLIEQMIIEFHPGVLAEPVHHYSAQLAQCNFINTKGEENTEINSNDVIHHFVNKNLKK